MIAARQIFLGRGGAKGYTAKDYVQDGLIAMWDGIENADWETHDSSATTWKDLIGSADIALHNAVIYDDHIYFSSASGYGTATLPYPYGAIEVVLAKGDSSAADRQCSVLVIGGTYSGYGLCAPLNRLMDTYDAGSGPYVNITPLEVFSATFNKSGGTTTEIAKNGVIGADGTVAAGSRYSTGTVGINGDGGSPRYSELWYRSIRIYSRNLTAYEIAANYAIDKRRFGLS